MKNSFSKRSIVRHIVTYVMCLFLAVLTWLLVSYADLSGKGSESGTPAALCESAPLLEYTVL